MIVIMERVKLFLEKMVYFGKDLFGWFFIMLFIVYISFFVAGGFGEIFWIIFIVFKC